MFTNQIKEKTAYAFQQVIERGFVMSRMRAGFSESLYLLQQIA